MSGATFTEAARMAGLESPIPPIEPWQAEAAERVIRARLGDNAGEVLAALGLDGAA